MYYSDPLKMLRTDELFAWNTTRLCDKILKGFLFAQDFNVYNEVGWDPFIGVRREI